MSPTSVRRIHGLTLTLGLVPAILLVTACSETRRAKGFLAGEATVSNPSVVQAAQAPPSAIYVSGFTVAAGAIKQEGGLFGEAEEAVVERPHLLGGGLLGGRGGDGGGGGGPGGIIERRTQPDRPTADQISAVLSASILEALRSEQLGIPIEQIATGAPAPASTWLVRGQFTSVDPGNRAQRAVIGFGAGEATTEVAVEVDAVSADGSAPVLQFGTQADSGHAPGAAVTMNPYAAAAKFVLGRQATQRDVQDMGKAIAKEIAKVVRQKSGVPAESSSFQG
ncbi:MAG TPA: DUF4410 domain-containing protein [Candidatus Binatia bacterium]|nr:DUF4410 domain-containing protein [Candidatus Binatia bacterium]